MPDWIWVGHPTYRYRNRETGRWAAEDDMRRWGRISIDAARDDSLVLAGALAELDLPLNEWHGNMRDIIKGEYVRQYLLGIGGRDQMTFADWGSVGGMLTEQYGWLDAFAAEIAAGELSEAQIAQRAQMYLNSSKEAFERAQSRAKEELAQVRWNLTAAEHCPDCEDFAALGWQDRAVEPYGGATPGSGATQCKTNCACFLSYR